MLERKIRPDLVFSKEALESDNSERSLYAVFISGVTGLPCQILVDHRSETPDPVMYFQANTSDRVDLWEMIPISVGDNPTLIYPELKYNLSENEFAQVVKFIKDHKEDLLRVAQNEEFTTSNFMAKLRKETENGKSNLA